MKTSTKVSLFKRGKQVLLGVALLAALSACKKSDGDSAGPNGGKNMKFTISVTGVTQNDFVSFAIAGSTTSSVTNKWKLNGVTQTSQQAISLGKNQFTGDTKTYVIESGEPLNAASVGIQCLATNNNSYKISYKAEIDGKVVNDDDNVTVTANADYTRQLSY